MDLQIRCINKKPRYDPHQRIRWIGGVNDDGSRWKLSLDEAIIGIDERRWRFFVNAGGRIVWVEIASHADRRYLKTEADGYSPDNLLSLPECG
jgi:hypothetical protein